MKELNIELVIKTFMRILEDEENVNIKYTIERRKNDKNTD